MLRKLRIVLGIIFLVGITLLFIGIGHEWWGWMAKLQFLPSCLALNVGVIAGILLLTILFGRLYCSVICPLGVFQDFIIWIRREIGKLQRKCFTKRAQNAKEAGKPAPVMKVDLIKRFHYKKEHKILRYGVLALFILCLILGLQVIVTLIAPYSAYGRIVQSIVNPIGWAVPVVAFTTLAVIVFLAWTDGRAWCNNICPVGTVLSFFSRLAIFRLSIDETKCNACGRCHRGCKASCIDGDARIIDYSRCVDCFDCIYRCTGHAIHLKYAYGKKKAEAKGGEEPAVDESKRAFLAGALMVGTAATLKAQDTKLEGSLAAIIDKKAPQRSERLTPPGSGSLKNFYSHCTACQLCVSTCPNGVLKPSTDLEHLLQPEMGYEKGYCRPECTACSQVCPAGAILPITPEEKTTIHIGHATVDYDLCVVNRDGVECGNCSRHCPAGAIVMVSKDPSDPDSPKIPSVLEDKCIGCGACENLCPSRPFSAIHVDGLNVHIKD